MKYEQLKITSEENFRRVTGIKRKTFDKLLLRRRGTVETVGGIMKNQLSMVHHRHRSPINFFTHIFATIVAYDLWKNKPTMFSGLEEGIMLIS